MDDTTKMRRRHEFGSTIALMRKMRGLSQEALALQAGVDRSYMGRVERGEQSMSLDLMWAIADVLGTTPATFFQTTERDEGPTLRS